MSKQKREFRVTCFAEADELLTGRCKSSRKIANNTYLERDQYWPDEIDVRLHATKIITYHRDGRVTLRSGGWQTHTTKDRMDRFTRARVWSDTGVWFVGWADRRYQYFDYMTLHPDGKASVGGRELEHMPSWEEYVYGALYAARNGLRSVTLFSRSESHCISAVRTHLPSHEDAHKLADALHEVLGDTVWHDRSRDEWRRAVAAAEVHLGWIDAREADRRERAAIHRQERRTSRLVAERLES